MAYFASKYEIRRGRLRIELENGSERTLRGDKKTAGPINGWLGKTAVFSDSTAYWTDGRGCLYYSSLSTVSDTVRIPERWKNNSGPPYYMEEICTWDESQESLVDKILGLLG